MKKSLLSIGGIIAIGALIFVFSNRSPKTTTYGEQAAENSANVYTENGKQVVEIAAKGGYAPHSSIAKAATPTIIRVKTSSTFDCSSSLRIPTINYFKNLPPTGTTDIEIPNQQAGTTLKALCSMGMYTFSVQFKS